MPEARRKGKLEPVGTSLGALLHSLGLDRRLREQRAVEAWEAVVGEVIARHARPAGIREGVLFVEVDSSVWMQELGILRDEIAARLNAQLGGSIVQRIVLAAEREPRADGGGPQEEEND